MSAHRFRDTFPRRVMEWTSATCTLSFGVLLGAAVMLENSALAEAGRDRYLESLRSIGSLDGWAAFAVTVGLVRLIALTINGAWRPTPHMRAVTAGLSGVIYLQLAFGVVDAAGPLIGIALLPPLLVGELYICHRASSEARLADDNARRRRAERLV